MDERKGDARHLTVRRFSSHAEAEAKGGSWWARLPPAERVLEAWRLSEEQWRLKGDTDESRFSRSVTRLLRR